MCYSGSEEIVKLPFPLCVYYDDKNKWHNELFYKPLGLLKLTINSIECTKFELYRPLNKFLNLPLHHNKRRKNYIDII